MKKFLNKLYEKSMFKNILKISEYMLASIINAVIAAASTVILTRIFSPETFGIVNLFNSASSVIMGIMCIGMDSSYIRFFYDPPNGDSNKVLAQKCILIPIVNVLLWGSLIVAFGGEQFSNQFIGIKSISAAIFIFANVLGQIIIRFLNINYRMQGDTHKYFVQSVLTQLFLKLFVVAAALITVNNVVIIGFNALGILFLACIYICIQFKSVFGDVKKTSLSYKGYKEVVFFAVFICPISIISYLNTYTSQLIIKKNLGAHDLGVFSAAALFIYAIAVFRTGFVTFWSPFMYKNYETHNKEICMANRIVILFCILGFCIILLASDLLYLLIGENFREQQQILGFLLINPLCITAMETTYYGIAIAKKNHISLINNLVSLLFNCALCYFFTQYWGLTGAVISSAVSGVLLFALNTFWGQKYYRSVDSILRQIQFIAVIFIISFLYYTLYSQKWIFNFIILTFLILELIRNKKLFSMILSLKKYNEGDKYE